MESAIYHACVNANVVSLHAIETGVSSLRQRYDQDADSVSDADIFSLVDTIERAKIPTISQISELNNDTNIADRVVSFLWKNILEKPSVFPSDWGMLANKPTTFPPATHTHEAQAVAVAWTDVTDKPTTFPPATHTHEAQAVAVAWSEVTDKPATFPPAEHTHEAQAVAVAWSAVTDKPTTFAPAEHTHPEYEGGGGTASAISRQWALLLNKAELTYLNLPATLWTGATMRLTASGVLPAYEADERLMRITEIATGNDLLQVFRFATTLMLIINPGYSVSVPYSGTSFEMEIEVTPTNFTLTVNGDATASADGGRVYTEEALSWTVVNMQTWTRCGCWTGDPATTAPLIIADAEHIDNNFLINQAARHIGAGQYDLTLDAPVIVYQ